MIKSDKHDFIISLNSLLLYHVQLLLVMEDHFGFQFFLHWSSKICDIDLNVDING